MADFATLILGADTRGLVKAKTDLAGVTKAGAVTEKQALKTGVALSSVSKSVVPVSGSLAGLSAAAQKVATSNTALNAATAASAMSFKDQAAEIATAAAESQVYAAEMDAIRAKFNPLFAVSQRYEMQLKEIAQAEKIGAISAREAGAARDRASASMIRMGAAGQKVTRINRGMAGGMRNLGLQLNQVAQVGGMTGNWMQALAIQMPDMLLGFGTLGVFAGIAAGAMIPLVSTLMDGADGAEATEENLDALNKTISDYQSAASMAGKSGQDLTKMFGTQSAAIQGTLDILRDVALSKALDGLNVSMGQLDSGQLRLWVDIFNEGKGEIAAFDDNFNSAVSALHDNFKLTGDQAKELLRAVEEMKSAQGPEAISESARKLNALLLATYGSVQNIPPEFRDMAEAAAQADVAASSIVGTIENAEAQTKNWAASMSGVRAEINAIMASLASIGGGLVGNAAKQTEIQALKAGKSIRDAAREARAFEAEAKFNAREQGANAFQRGLIGLERFQYDRGAELDAALDAERDAVRKRDRAASRTGGAAAKAAKDNARDAKRIFDETRTALEKYNLEVAGLNRLQEMGAINADTHNRAIKMAAEGYREAALAESEFTEITGTLKESILDFAGGAENAFDSLKEAIKRAALEALIFGEGPFASLLSGGGGGGTGFFGLIGSLFSADGGGYTGSGARSGGVDGKGGFPAILHPQETVVDHTKGQSMPGGTSVVKIELSPELVGSILTKAAGNSVQITQMGARAQERGVGRSVTNFTERKG